MIKKEKQNGVGIGPGGISILAIFVVLCLAVLSALSLVSARADYNLSRKTADAQTEYYAADARAEELLASIVIAARQGEGWKESILGLHCGVEEAGHTALVSFTVPINEQKELNAQVEITLDAQGNPTGQWKRALWQTAVIENDEETSGLNVL